MMPALQNSRSFLTREFNPDRKKGKKKEADAPLQREGEHSSHEKL